jgi:hypothetical protein
LNPTQLIPIAIYKPNPPTTCYLPIVMIIT